MKRSGHIEIGLLWHSMNSGNLGVGALTVGNLIAAREAAAAVGLTPHFTVMEFQGDFGPAYVSGDDIDSFQITRASLTSPAGYWAQLGKLDCVLDIGGGDSYADIYDVKRFTYIAATKELAYLRGVPLLFSPQTIGPFTRRPYTAIARHQLSRAVTVVARDPQSMDALRRIAPRAKAVQSIDVAFRLPFERPAPRSGGPLKVGVNVSALLYREAHRFGLAVDYAELMRRFIAAQLSQPGTEVHLICHVNSDLIPNEDDGQVADELAREFPAVIRAPNFVSPSAAKSYIAGLDFLTAGRMHACIAAFSAGVPVVPVAYSRKFSGLFEGALNYRHMVPVTGVTTDEAFAYLMDSLAGRETLRREIIQGQTVVAAALGAYDAELKALFKRVAGEDAR
jgi:polysaccharide pyruvyl transferase WcaK-like protein